jgi:hypothetical protein
MLTFIMYGTYRREIVLFDTCIGQLCCMRFSVFCWIFILIRFIDVKDILTVL